METVCWTRVPGLPLGVAAVLEALRMDGHFGEPLKTLSEADWRGALDFCDRSQLTLLLAHRSWSMLPCWVQERLDRNLAGHRLHSRLLKSETLRICSQLTSRSIDYLLLKGISCGSDFSHDPSLRVQYDIDLYCPDYALPVAARTVLAAGYKFHAASRRRPTDHLPTMVRKTDWRWRGDYFDPAIPPSVDLHFRFWDETTERLPAPGVDEFWGRRIPLTLDGQTTVFVLNRADSLGYAALHLLRHLLRGSARPYHVYELAFFLNNSADVPGFWQDWASSHPPELRKLEAISFGLAASWFGCRCSPVVHQEFERLPEGTQAWFDSSAAAPVAALFRPNKEELWLHLPLLGSTGDRLRVLRRRLFPAFMSPGEAGLSYSLSRVHFHAVSTPRSIWRIRKEFHGPQWWVESRRLEPRFWSFLAAGSLYNLGAFIFFLLYSLYLLDLGYQEKFLGLISAATAVGNVGGALLAVWVSGRAGLSTSLALGFAGAGAISAVRCLTTGDAPLLAAAFLGGVLASFWFVLFSPAISNLVDEQQRPSAFSLFAASGVGMGALGGLAGGQFPGVFQRMLWFASPLEAKRATLLVGCFLCLLAAWPVSRLSLEGAIQRRNGRLYGVNPFLVRFLVVIGVWSLAIGCFDPFLSAYLARTAQASVSQIGWLFSASQIVQAGAVLLSPMVLRKFGLIGGVVSLQLATAVALASLGAGPPLVAAGALCAMYRSFQAMCEPGTYSLLMGRVSAPERSSAAALNFLVLFCTQAAAATAAGAAISRFGYSVVLWAAAALAVVAAILFRSLLETAEPAGLRSEIGAAD